MANNIHQQVEARVQAFVSELSELVRAAALEAVSDALGGTAPAGARRGRPKGAKGKSTTAVAAKPHGKRGKRTSEQVDQMAAQIYEHVKKHPGASVELMAKAFKHPSKVLTLPIAKLMASKKLKTTGQKRGTKYFVK